MPWWGDQCGPSVCRAARFSRRRFGLDSQTTGMESGSGSRYTAVGCPALPPRRSGTSQNVYPA